MLAQAKIILDRLAPWNKKSCGQPGALRLQTRTYHIGRSGTDANIVEQYKGKAPTTIAMQPTKRVPGAPEKCRNLFDLSQILAWLTKERRDVQEQLEWRAGGRTGA